MKSILQGLKEEKIEKKEFPWLGISKEGCVVLFTSIRTGTLVHEAPHKQVHGVGNYDTCWTPGDFEPLKGKIILSN